MRLTITRGAPTSDDYSLIVVEMSIVACHHQHSGHHFFAMGRQAVSGSSAQGTLISNQRLPGRAEGASVWSLV